MAKVKMVPNQMDSTNGNKLYIGFELSNSKWKLAISDGFKRRHITVAARDLDGLKKQIDKAREHFGVGRAGAVYSCYEAGRDGFWIHRFLTSIGLDNIIVDSSSIEVNRRFRRAKTDRVDAQKLMTMLMRYLNGEQKLWGVVHVPDSDQEDDRRVNREIERLKKERTAHTNRITSLLILHGVKMRVGGGFLEQLDQVRLWDGKKLGHRIKKEILREYERLELIKAQLAELEQEKQQMLESGSVQTKYVEALQKFKGIGPVSSWVLVYEFFGWRQFANVKQVGAAAGLTPTPYDSGGSTKEQGISKAGNRRVRSVMIELAWYWLRYQPGSELSRWYHQRFANGSKRTRRIGIVAVARKLLVGLWKYLDKQIVPAGSIFKQAA